MESPGPTGRDASIVSWDRDPSDDTNFLIPSKCRTGLRNSKTTDPGISNFGVHPGIGDLILSSFIPGFVAVFRHAHLLLVPSGRFPRPEAAEPQHLEGNEKHRGS